MLTASLGCVPSLQAKEIVAKYNLKVVRIHTHIGSGSDPLVWQRVAKLNMDTVKQFPDVTTLNMGGGFKATLSTFCSVLDCSFGGLSSSSEPCKSLRLLEV